MERCAICGKPREDLESGTVYTARLLDQSKEKTGYRAYEIKMRYGDFKQHTYEVCNACLMRKGCIVPIVVYGALVPLLALLFGITNSTSFWGAMLYLVGALFVALLPAVLVEANFNVGRTLVRKALAARKREHPGGNYKGYTAKEYKALNVGLLHSTSEVRKDYQ